MVSLCFSVCVLCFHCQPRLPSGSNRMPESRDPSLNSLTQRRKSRLTRPRPRPGYTIPTIHRDPQGMYTFWNVQKTSLPLSLRNGAAWPRSGKPRDRSRNRQFPLRMSRGAHNFSLLQADYDKFHTNMCIYIYIYYTYAILYRTAAARGRAKPWFLIKPLEYEFKLGTN